MQSDLEFQSYAPRVRDQAIVMNLVLAGVYVLAAWIGLRFASIHPSVTTLWPPSGIALAAMLLGGPRVLPGIALGAATISFWTSSSVGAALCIALGNSLEAFLAYLLLQRVPKFNLRLGNLRSVLSLAGTAILAPMPAAVMGPLSLNGFGQISAQQLGSLITQWWMGDFLGMLLVAPVILAWWGHYRLRFDTHRARAPVWLLIGYGIVSFGVLDGRLDWLMGGSPTLYIILPIAILIALGEEVRLSALANLVVFVLALWGLSRGHGPFVRSDPNGETLYLHLFLTIVAITSLLVAALSSERAHALRESQRNLDRFRALTALSADWYWETDPEQRFTFVSEGFEERSGLCLAEVLGRTRDEIAKNTFESEEARKRHLEIIKERKPFRDLILRRVGTDDVTRWACVSGEPVFDTRGEFLGYRGVGRDNTAFKQAEIRKEESSRFLDILINAIASPVLVKDESHRYIAANDAFSAFFARPLSEILGKTDFDFFQPEGAKYFQKTDDEALAHGHVEYESAYPVANKVYWMLVRKSSVHLPDGRRIVVLIMTDVTKRRIAEERLRDSEQRFRDFAQAAGDFAFETDLQSRITYLSSLDGKVWGYPSDELVGRVPGEFMPEGEAERVREWLSENMREDGSFRDLQHRVINKQGEERWMLVNAVGSFDADGNRIGQRGSARDITDRKSTEDRINFLATRDALTGLPNRVLFGDRITQAITAARRTGQMLALFFMDLDRFKHINDSLGHEVGDLLLKQVAERMLDCIRKRDTLARLGGDEFVMALEGLQHAEDAAQIAAKIIRAIAQPFEIGGHSLITSCSLGISVFPNDAEDERTLMKNADTAMYHAKERGRNNFQFFSPDMNARAVERNKLEIALRRSVEAGDFTLHYQPLVHIRTAKVIGVEALLRWNHPEKGLVTPAAFIDVAEDCGLIEPIGQWVIREACRCAKQWELAGYPALKVAVNVSGRQLIKPTEFSRTVTRALSETGLDPRLLELELSESVLQHNADDIATVLRKLAREGIQIVVDDFGTGYSSLSHLRQLPINTVKIDRSLIRGVENGVEASSLIQAIVAMAHGFDLKITAEGVETRAQLDAVRQLGCDAYQGNIFCKPMPAIDIAAKYLAPGLLDLHI